MSGCAENIVTVASVCGDDQTPGAWQTIKIRPQDKISDPTSADILKGNEARKVICKGKGAEHG